MKKRSFFEELFCFCVRDETRMPNDKRPSGLRSEMRRPSVRRPLKADSSSQINISMNEIANDPPIKLSSNSRT